MLEKLSLSDATSFADAVSKQGVLKSGLASNIDALVAKCASSDEDEALAGLATAKALAETCPSAEVFTKECLTACKCYRISLRVRARTHVYLLHETRKHSLFNFLQSLIRY
jgi:hypothetical protein